jgi:hypothetical protein
MRGDVGVFREGVGDVELVLDRRVVVLQAPVRSDDHDVGAASLGLRRQLLDPGRVDDRDRPGSADGVGMPFVPYVAAMRPTRTRETSRMSGVRDAFLVVAMPKCARPTRSKSPSVCWIP